MNRPDLIATFTKIELWRQTQFTRIVYLDADILALRAPDELLTLSLSETARTGTSPGPGPEGEGRIAAAPDAGWPDCFNSGVMALTPDLSDYHALRDLATHGVSFDGADQGLLNMYFGGAWRRLSFGYNCTSGTAGNQYQYAPAFRHFERSVSLVHFVGYRKPWSALDRQDGMVQKWWDVYRRCSIEPCPTQGASDVGQLDSQYYGHVSSVQPLQESGLEPEQPQETEPPWDASREPPPLNTKPEGIALQQHTYHMSTDTRLYQPDPILEKPETGKIPQIFPWENRAPKPTRVFADDAEWQVIDRDVTLDTKLAGLDTKAAPTNRPWEKNSAWDVPKTLASLHASPHERVLEHQMRKPQSNLDGTDGHDRQRDEWVATTAGGLLDMLKMVYLYGVFTGV